MITLGINAAFHDPAACLVRDGVIVAAAEEERFTHVKHGKRPVPFTAYELPFHAIDYCLKAADVSLKDVDLFGYSYDPALFVNPDSRSRLSLALEPNEKPLPDGLDSPWDPLFLSYVLNAPRFLIDGVPHHLEKRWRGAHYPNGQWRYLDHHLCHAVSGFHASPFHEAAVLTLDGRAERATSTYSTGAGNELNRIGEVQMPHSLGMLYERVTQHLGFLHSCDEYKVMALASFGQPTFVHVFEELIRRDGGGNYQIDQRPLEECLGPPRLRGEPIEQRHYDIAHSLQKVLEHTVIDIAHWLRRETGLRQLCMAGGVALNCVMNARVRDAGIFDDIWVQPAAGDAGTALGAALWLDAQEQPRNGRCPPMNHAFLGPCFDEEEIAQFLAWSKLPYHRMTDVAEETAAVLAQNKVIGWFQTGMEFGPRSLGARSILASPIDPGMQARLNEIKDREDFRPVAPMVIEEDAGEWFEGARQSPYMLFVFRVHPEKAAQIPAVCHFDGTARVQTLNRTQNAACYDLLQAFKRLTGVGVLVNTSFNTRGEPIVCTPRDAVESYLTSPLDALIIGPFMLQKQTTLS